MLCIYNYVWMWLPAMHSNLVLLIMLISCYVQCYMKLFFMNKIISLGQKIFIFVFHFTFLKLLKVNIFVCECVVISVISRNDSKYFCFYLLTFCVFIAVLNTYIHIYRVSKNALCQENPLRYDYFFNADMQEIFVAMQDVTSRVLVTFLYRQRKDKDTCSLIKQGF